MPGCAHSLTYTWWCIGPTMRQPQRYDSLDDLSTYQRVFATYLDACDVPEESGATCSAGITPHGRSYICVAGALVHGLQALICLLHPRREGLFR